MPPPPPPPQHTHHWHHLPPHHRHHPPPPPPWHHTPPPPPPPLTSPHTHTHTPLTSHTPQHTHHWHHPPTTHTPLTSHPHPTHTPSICTNACRWTHTHTPVGQWISLCGAHDGDVFPFLTHHGVAAHSNTDWIWSGYKTRTGRKLQGLTILFLNCTLYKHTGTISRTSHPGFLLEQALFSYY